MSQFSRMMKQQVFVAELTGRNTSGDPEYGEPECIRARHREESKLVVGIDGNEVNSTDVIATDCRIPKDALVWLPDADETDQNQARRVIATKSESSISTGAVLYETRF